MTTISFPMKCQLQKTRGATLFAIDTKVCFIFM